MCSATSTPTVLVPTQSAPPATRSQLYGDGTARLVDVLFSRPLRRTGVDLNHG